MLTAKQQGRDGATRSGEKRRLSARDGGTARVVCVHYTPAHIAALKRSVAAPDTRAEVTRLHHYVLDSAATVEVERELYQCLSCPFQGAREATVPQLREREDEEDDGSFMAHAILHNHPMALLVRKQRLYCASCRDFVYPDATSGRRFRRRKRQTHGTMPRALLRRGLVNMGNTCFLSSVLQALAHNPMLQHYFFVARSHDTTICQQQRRRLLLKQQQQQEQKLEGHDGAEESGEPATSVCLGCELATFMAQLLPSSTQQQQQALAAPPMAPQGILEAVWSAFPAFVGTAQHDAHELFIALLGGLHSHTHPRVFVHGGASPRFTPRGHSLCDCAVHQHFSGVLRSELACADCGSASYKFDPFLDVSLSFDDGKRHGGNSKRHDKKEGKGQTALAAPVLTLEALLRQFSAEEELHGVNQVYCLRCAKYRNNLKRLRLHTLPNVLVFHIRRLDFYRQRKLQQIVRFPLLGLCMGPFKSVDDCDSEVKAKMPHGESDESVPRPSKTEDNDDVYDLVATVNHHGASVDGGHYTAYVRDTATVSRGSSSQPNELSRQQWILFDDTKVKTVPADEVQRSQAYILYYVRRHPVVAVGA